MKRYHIIAIIGFCLLGAANFSEASARPASYDSSCAITVPVKDGMEKARLKGKQLKQEGLLRAGVVEGLRELTANGSITPEDARAVMEGFDSN